jgi:hypothetical protein
MRFKEHHFTKNLGSLFNILPCKLPPFKYFSGGVCRCVKGTFKLSRFSGLFRWINSCRIFVEENGSDRDMTFLGENLNLVVLNKATIEMDDLLLPYSFDLSIYKDSSNKDFIEHMNSVGVVFYQKEYMQKES